MNIASPLYRPSEGAEQASWFRFAIRPVDSRDFTVVAVHGRAVRPSGRSPSQVLGHDHRLRVSFENADGSRRICR